MKKVLIVTWNADHPGTEGVAAAIRRRGAQVIRLNTDDFPSIVKLSYYPDDQGERVYLDDAEGRHDLSDLTAIWYRRMRPALRLDKEELGADVHYACVEEARQHLIGLVEGRDIFVVDSPHVLRRNEVKARQARLARLVGLDVPRSLYTNNPEEARAFVASCPHGAVTKMMTMFSVRRGAEVDVVFTNRVKPEDLEHLDGLAQSPMIFQELVPKARELRVAVVGDKLFTIGINSAATARGQVDWRRSSGNPDSVWAADSLPPEIAAKLLRLGDMLGQNYGGVDFIITPDGRYVFLEWNPAGEYGWVLEHHAGPMEEAYADLLLGEVRPRKMYP